jgi:predicted RNase H-like nuclease
MAGSKRSYVVGVDGCKAGWFAVRLNSDGTWDTRSFADIQSLWGEWRGADRILIDMPIGLPDRKLTFRHCDGEARKLLGRRRASSVFSAPSRASLEAHSYRHASILNRREVGRRLTRQSYSIIPKIRQLDDLLASDGLARQAIREVHPEICFWALNRCCAMRHGKSLVPFGPAHRP